MASIEVENKKRALDKCYEKLGRYAYIHELEYFIGNDEWKNLMSSAGVAYKVFERSVDEYCEIHNKNICLNCLTQISEGETYCPKCGEAVKMRKIVKYKFCRKCGMKIDREDNFCAYCGQVQL